MKLKSIEKPTLYKPAKDSQTKNSHR